MNSYPIGGGTAWPGYSSASHVSAETFADCVKEFRQYGYDPYNSADDAQLWFIVMDGQEEKHVLARAVPA